MMMLIAFVVGVLFSAAFPGPAMVIRSMVTYCWSSAVNWFQSMKKPSDPPAPPPGA